MLFQYEIIGLSNLRNLKVIYLKHQHVSACYHMGELFAENHHNSIDLINLTQKNQSRDDILLLLFLKSLVL